MQSLIDYIRNDPGVIVAAIFLVLVIIVCVPFATAGGARNVNDEPGE